jgi:hypothetical protein
MLNVVMLNVIILGVIKLNVIILGVMLNVVLMNVVILSVVMLDIGTCYSKCYAECQVSMLNVTMMIVILLNVIMLSVVAPPFLAPEYKILIQDVKSSGNFRLIFTSPLHPVKITKTFHVHSKDF